MPQKGEAIRANYQPIQDGLRMRFACGRTSKTANDVADYGVGAVAAAPNCNMSPSWTQFRLRARQQDRERFGLAMAVRA